MRYALFFMPLLLILNACSSATDNTTEDTTKQLDSSQTNNSTLVDEEPIDSLLEEFGPVLDEIRLIRPSTFRLEGSIGDKYAITMSLSYDYGKLKDPNNKSKIEVTGTYAYNSSSSSLELKGEIDQATQTMVLFRIKNAEKDEIFSGKYVGQFDSYSGDWKKTKKNKTLSFQLKRMPSSIPLQTQRLFAQKLNEIFVQTSKRELLPANKVGIDRYGIYIKDSVKWYPSCRLSNSSFEARTWNESLKANWEYAIQVQLWQFEESEDFVIFMESSFSSYTIKDDEESLDKEENTTSIWKYDGSNFIDLLDKKSADIGWTAKFASEVVNHVLVNKTTISDSKTNKTWLWDKEKKLLSLN